MKATTKLWQKRIPSLFQRRHRPRKILNYWFHALHAENFESFAIPPDSLGLIQGVAEFTFG